MLHQSFLTTMCAAQRQYHNHHNNHSVIDSNQLQMPPLAKQHSNPMNLLNTDTSATTGPQQSFDTTDHLQMPLHALEQKQQPIVTTTVCSPAQQSYENINQCQMPCQKKPLDATAAASAPTALGLQQAAAVANLSTPTKRNSSSAGDCGGGGGSSGKTKRIRTIFTPYQLERLEQEFSVQMYLVGMDRLKLAKSLGLSEAQVKVWFQNRRIKFRKLNPSPFLSMKSFEDDNSANSNGNGHSNNNLTNNSNHNSNIPNPNNNTNPAIVMMRSNNSSSSLSSSDNYSLI